MSLHGSFTARTRHQVLLRELYNIYIYIIEYILIYIYIYVYTFHVLGFKDLKQIFPESHGGILVVDDREDVWPPEMHAHLLKVLPFLPFEGDLRQGLGLEQLVTGIKQTQATPFVKRRRLDDSKGLLCGRKAHEGPAAAACDEDPGTGSQGVGRCRNYDIVYI